MTKTAKPAAKAPAKAPITTAARRRIASKAAQEALESVAVVLRADAAQDEIRAIMRDASLIWGQS